MPAGLSSRQQNHSFLVLPPATALVSLGVDLATGTSGTYVEGNTEEIFVPVLLSHDC